MGGTLQRVRRGRPPGWHDHAKTCAGADDLRRELLHQAGPRSEDRCLDLGAGSGFLTVPLAERTSRVCAVEATEAIQQIRARNHDNVVTLGMNPMTLVLPYQCVDLVVSAFALHHLRHEDKCEIIRRVRLWLRPGGRIVIGDLMPRSGSARRLPRPGVRPGGGGPASPTFWMGALRDVGFRDIAQRRMSDETGLVWGHL